MIFRSCRLAFLAVLMPFLLCAAELGPDVAVYRGQELKWEDGNYNYQVIFKSLLSNLNTNNDMFNDNYCPRPDACAESAAATLNSDQLPIDAQVEKAFLVWSAAQPLAKIDDLTDNTVRLEFFHNSALGLNLGVDIVGREARLTDPQDFEFESYIETVGDTKLGYSVHRVDVTDFFKQIQEEGRSLEISDGTDDGRSLYGAYTVSGLDCTEDPAYRDTSAMLADWSLVLVYNSSEVSRQKVYIYSGFQPYRHERTERLLTGFELPSRPQLRLTMMTHGGYTGMFDLTESRVPESLEMAGEKGDFLPLWNECNPQITLDDESGPFTYTEIFSLSSSSYGFDPSSGPTCSFGPSRYMEGMPEYAIDVDTFYINATEGWWSELFYRGVQELSLAVGANENRVFTDLAIFSHEVPLCRRPEVEKNDLVYCACTATPGTICAEQSFWYAITVENWCWDNPMTGVKIQDTLPSDLEYVPGTAQIASTFELDEADNLIGTDWTTIPEEPVGSFPFEKPYLVAEELVSNCESPGSCDPSKRAIRMVRFMVKPKPGLSPGTVIENIGFISEVATSSKPHMTNGSIPLQITVADCTPVADCGPKPFAACGFSASEWSDDDDAILADDDMTVPDIDMMKSKDDGCGCSVVW